MRLLSWLASSPVPEQFRMVRPCPLPVRWAFFKHDSERSFDDVRSLVLRRFLTQRFRYFVAINELAKATAGKHPDGSGPDQPLTFDWVLRHLDDARPDRRCHHEPGDVCPRGVHLSDDDAQPVRD